MAELHGLNDDERQRYHYRRQSILDVLNESITSQQHVHFLNEHFRSTPQIIDFSNREFYANSLAVMRRRPASSVETCVLARRIEEGRKEGGTNPAEAEAILDQLTEIVEEQSGLPAAACQSMGVLSPFRDQVDLIGRQLEKRLKLADFQRHDLQVGTAHAFQGDERDIMFLSLVVDADSHHASIRFINNPNLLNVAITRARHRQFIFHSIPIDRLGRDTLLRRYLESIERPARSTGLAESTTRDPFLHELRDEMKRRGFRTWSGYELGGMTIDLVVERSGVTMGIDLIGFPGRFAPAFELERYRILQRAGLQLFPLPFSRWKQDREKCLRAIEASVTDASQAADSKPSTAEPT